MKTHIDYWIKLFVYWIYFWYKVKFIDSIIYKFLIVIRKFRKFTKHFNLCIIAIFLKYVFCLRNFFFSEYQKKIINFSYIKEKYYQKGNKNLGIYFKDFIINSSYKNFYQNLTILNSYCYLLIRLNRKNLFLTLLNNEGNVICKTNIGASGFKKKVKRTGYAIKGTGKNFVKIIKATLLKNIFVLYKNIENNNELKKNIKFLKFIENKNIKLKNIKRKKINKNYIKINKNIKINILKKNTKKIIRSKLLWIKIFKNLQKYRIYYSLLNLNNLIKKKLRIILRIKTSLKLWAFRFVVYGLFKKLPWFRGIEFRLPIPHSNGLRLKKKRRV